MNETLRPDQGDTLLALARAALHGAFGQSDVATPEPGGWLARYGASFVTLRQDDELRGCIGTLLAHRPLHEDVRENALAAAFRDPRFPPLSRRELPRTSIEVSVLSQPRPLEVSSEAEAIAALRPGVDGVVLAAGWRRSTFLPQVWEELPDPGAFLAHLKMKAGLPSAGWPAGTSLQTYRVTKFAEAPRATRT